MLTLRSLGVTEFTDATGAGVNAVLRQPKRFAFFLYLVTRRPSPIATRAELLALFWPERDEDHARNALNRTLHFLRGQLTEGTLPSLGRSRVGVEVGQVSCDALAFRECLDSGDKEGAFSLYRGDFLPGLHVNDAPAFNEWLDQERAWYRRQACAAGLGLIEADLSRGRVQAGMEWAAELNRIAPNDEGVVRATVRAHLRAGDRAGALTRLERFEAWLRKELGMGVPADLVRLFQDDPPHTPATPVMRPRTDDPPLELLAASRAAMKVETLEEHQDFIDVLPDAAFRCDLRGSFPFVNDVTVRVFGYSREEFRNTSYDQLVREDFRDRVIEFYVRQVDDRIPITYLEFPAMTKDGRELWVGQRVRLIERDGIPMGIEGVTRDITTRVRREKANRRSALEDRETRLLNREGFALVGRQRIRENRRSKEPFFVLHVRASREEGANPELSAADATEAVRVIGAVLRHSVREADAVGRIDEMELAVLSVSGGWDDARAMQSRIEATLGDARDMRELASVAVHCEAVVHDAALLTSADALMTFAWVVDG